MLLIDADTYAYVAAALAENEDDMQARFNLNKMLEDTLVACNDFEFICYLTGPNNFRYKVYPEYKAQRKDQKKPQFLAACRQHLIDEYKAIVSDGCEADDLVGVEHYKRGCETTIVHSDKDLNQFVGWHYNPKKKERYLVSPMDGMRFFYTQLLQGDTADNIKGCSGIGPIKAKRMLEHCTNEAEMFDVMLMG